MVSRRESDLALRRKVVCSMKPRRAEARRQPRDATFGVDSAGSELSCPASRPRHWLAASGNLESSASPRPGEASCLSRQEALSSCARQEGGTSLPQPQTSNCASSDRKRWTFRGSARKSDVSQCRLSPSSRLNSLAQQLVQQEEVREEPQPSAASAPSFSQAATRKSHRQRRPPRGVAARAKFDGKEEESFGLSSSSLTTAAVPPSPCPLQTPSSAPMNPRNGEDAKDGASDNLEPTPAQTLQLRGSSSEISVVTPAFVTATNLTKAEKTARRGGPASSSPCWTSQTRGMGSEKKSSLKSEGLAADAAPTTSEKTLLKSLQSKAANLAMSENRFGGATEEGQLPSDAEKRGEGPEDVHPAKAPSPSCEEHVSAQGRSSRGNRNSLSSSGCPSLVASLTRPRSTHRWVPLPHFASGERDQSDLATNHPQQHQQHSPSPNPVPCKPRKGQYSNGHFFPPDLKTPVTSHSAPRDREASSSARRGGGNFNNILRSQGWLATGPAQTPSNGRQQTKTHHRARISSDASAQTARRGSRVFPSPHAEARNAKSHKALNSQRDGGDTALMNASSERAEPQEFGLGLVNAGSRKDATEASPLNSSSVNHKTRTEKLAEAMSLGLSERSAAQRPVSAELEKGAWQTRLVGLKSSCRTQSGLEDSGTGPHCCVRSAKGEARWSHGAEKRRAEASPAAVEETRYSGVPVLEPLNKALFFLREWNRTAAENIRISKQHTATYGANADRRDGGERHLGSSFFPAPQKCTQTNTQNMLYSKPLTTPLPSAPLQASSLSIDTLQNKTGTVDEVSKRKEAKEESLQLGTLKGAALEAVVGTILSGDSSSTTRTRRGEPAALRNRRLELFFASLSSSEEERLSGLGSFNLTAASSSPLEACGSPDSHSNSTGLKVQTRILQKRSSPSGPIGEGASLTAPRDATVLSNQKDEKLRSLHEALATSHSPHICTQRLVSIQRNLEGASRATLPLPVAVPELYRHHQSLPSELQSLLELAQSQLAAQEQSRCQRSAVDITLLKALAESLAREVQLQRELQTQLQSQLQRLLSLQLRGEPAVQTISEETSLEAVPCNKALEARQQQEALLPGTSQLRPRTEEEQERAAQVERLRQRVIWRLLDDIQVDRQSLLLRQLPSGGALENESLNSPLKPFLEDQLSAQRRSFAVTETTQTIFQLISPQPLSALTSNKQTSVNTQVAQEFLRHLAALQDFHRSHSDFATVAPSSSKGAEQHSDNPPPNVAATACNSRNIQSEMANLFLHEGSPLHYLSGASPASDLVQPSAELLAAFAVTNNKTLSTWQGGTCAVSVHPSEKRFLRSLRLLQSPLWSWWISAMKKAWIQEAPVLAGVSSDCLSLLSERLALLEVPFPILASDALDSEGQTHAPALQAEEELDSEGRGFGANGNTSDSAACRQQFTGFQVREFIRTLVADSSEEADMEVLPHDEDFRHSWRDQSDPREWGVRTANHLPLFTAQAEGAKLEGSVPGVHAAQYLQSRRSSVESRRRRLTETLESQLQIKLKLFWLLERSRDVVVSLRCIDTSSCKLVRVACHQRRMFAGNGGWTAEADFEELLQGALALASARVQREVGQRRLLRLTRNGGDERKRNSFSVGHFPASSSPVPGEMQGSPLQSDSADSGAGFKYYNERGGEPLGGTEKRENLRDVARQALIEVMRLSLHAKRRTNCKLPVSPRRRVFAVLKVLRSDSLPPPFHHRAGRRFLRSALREVKARGQQWQLDCGVKDELGRTTPALTFPEGFAFPGLSCSASPRVELRKLTQTRLAWRRRQRQSRSVDFLQEETQKPIVAGLSAAEKASTRQSGHRTAAFAQTEEARNIASALWSVVEDSRISLEQSIPDAEAMRETPPSKALSASARAETQERGLSSQTKVRRRQLSVWQLVPLRGAETLWVAVPGMPICVSCGGFMRGLAVACTGQVGWLLNPHTPSKQTHTAVGIERDRREIQLQKPGKKPCEEEKTSYRWSCSCTYTPGGDEGFIEPAVAPSGDSFFVPSEDEETESIHSNADAECFAAEMEGGVSREAFPSSCSVFVNLAEDMASSGASACEMEMEAGKETAEARVVECEWDRTTDSVGRSNGLALLALARVACRAGLIDRVTDSLLSHSATALSPDTLESRPALALLGFLALLRDAAVPKVAQQQPPLPCKEDQQREGAALSSERPSHPLRRIVSRRVRQLLSLLFRLCLRNARTKILSKDENCHSAAT